MAAAALDTDSLDNLKLEDSLDLILDMVMMRSSVCRNPIARGAWSFGYDATMLDRLQRLRDMVLALAPSFVNMEYPYWDCNWSKFPVMFSADYINRDPDHGLNTLPGVGQSFDAGSIGVYRAFVKNVVYWLERFRCIVADRTYYDKSFRRRWEWTQSKKALAIAYEWEYTENGSAWGACNEGKLGQLQASQQGEVLRATPSSYLSSLIVGLWYDGNFHKWHQHERETPLHEFVEKNYSYQLTGVPQNLVTSNPTGYRADLYWYIVPHTELDDHTIGLNADIQEVTERDGGTTRTWGSDGQYSGVEYSAVAAENTSADQIGRRGQLKEFHYVKETAAVQRTRDTNWSDDGTRFFVVRDTTGPGSFYAASNWSMYDEYIFSAFGLVPALSASAPRVLAGRLAPHAKLSYHVCDQQHLPAPSFAAPTPVYCGEPTYSWGIDSTSLRHYYASTKWVPILDFMDFVQEGEEVGGGEGQGS